MALEEQTITPRPPLNEFARWAAEIAQRTVDAVQGIYSVEIHRPPGIEEYRGISASQSFGSVIDEVREFRAKAFFADGRRPAFRTADGVFTDVERADEYACHLVCRDKSGAPVGYVRAGRVDLLPGSAVAEHLGVERTARELDELGLGHSQVLELGRLVVVADQRGQGVAASLLFMTHIVTRRSGCTAMWGTAGLGDGQDRYLTRFGSKVLPGSAAYVPKYEDEACVIVHDHRLTWQYIQRAIEIAEHGLFPANHAEGKFS
jgi:predicted N-acetyltransferase YhbS